MNLVSPEELSELMRFLSPRERVEANRLIAAPLSLHEFVKEFWCVVEPAHKFVDNWHIGAICEHLEASTFGEIRDLIINVPPGTMKSLTVNVFWFCWEWAWNPASQWIFGSHSEDLALRDSLKCRRLIESPEYQKAFGRVFDFREDQNTKTKFENDKTGHRLAVGIGGGGTGERADHIVADDPTKALDADSVAALNKAKTWWFETMSTRDRDMQTCTRTIIMQRLNLKDLTGEVEAKRLGYEHLMLPMRYEKAWTVPETKLGFKDPRTVEGELLFPERMPEEAVRKTEESLGSHGTAGQLQQRPVVRGGSVIKREWFEPYINALDVNTIQAKSIYVDLGESAEEAADLTAATVSLKLRDDSFVIVWQYSGQWNPNERNENVLRFCVTWNQIFPQIPIWIEAGIGLGVTSAKAIKNKLIGAGLAAKNDKVNQSKFLRASAQKDSFLTAAEAKRVKLYAGDLFESRLQPLGYGTANTWIEKYLTQLSNLKIKQTPTGIVFIGDKDDLFDSSVGNHNKLVKLASGSIDMAALNRSLDL